MKRLALMTLVAATSSNVDAVSLKAVAGAEGFFGNLVKAAVPAIVPEAPALV